MPARSGVGRPSKALICSKRGMMMAQHQHSATAVPARARSAPLRKQRRSARFALRPPARAALAFSAAGRPRSVIENLPLHAVRVAAIDPFATIRSTRAFRGALNYAPSMFATRRNPQPNIELLLRSCISHFLCAPSMFATRRNPRPNIELLLNYRIRFFCLDQLRSIPYR